MESNQADLIAFQDRANLARNSVRDSYHSTCAFYSDEIRLRQQDELAVTRALEQAFECSEFIIFLQPKVRLTDGVVAGAEALVRWLHPDRGVVGPGAFIPLCEKPTSSAGWILKFLSRYAGFCTDGFRQGFP